jgi:sodium transport system permease protein
MNTRTVHTIFRKEMLDAVRDPRALLYLVGLPLGFYPILLLFLEYVAHGIMGGMTTPPYAVYVNNIETATALVRTIDEAPDLLLVPSTAPGLAVAQGQAAVGLEPIAGFDEAVAAGVSPRIDLYVNQSIPAYADVRELVLAALTDYEARTGAATLVAETSLGAAEDITFMVGLFPYFLVVLILVGAAHMAVDITAGEKERRTLETLLVAPAARSDILAGKTLATLAAAMSAALLGMLGFAAAIALADWLTGGRAYLLALPANAYWVMGIGSLPSAFFLSALLITLGTFARSSREGQTYAAYLQMPLLLLALGATYLTPAGASWPYVVPLLGVNLMQKEYLAGGGSTPHALVAVGSTVLLGVVLVLVSTWLFRRESILFRE